MAHLFVASPVSAILFYLFLLLLLNSFSSVSAYAPDSCSAHFLPTIVLNFIQFIVTKYFHPKNLAAKQYDAHCVSSWHLANTLGTLLCMQELPNPQTKVDTNTNHHCFCIVNFSIFTLADSFTRCPKMLDSLNSTTTCASTLPYLNNQIFETFERI